MLLRRIAKRRIREAARKVVDLALLEMGTSDGAVKGWETRKQGGKQDEKEPYPVICMLCKKHLRGPKVTDRNRNEVSHGLCDECLEKNYPED